MTYIISCSTGLLYRFFDDSDPYYFDKIINLLKNFGFDGFELGFHKVARLKNFNLSKDSVDFLKSLKGNTLHAPCDFVFGNNKESKLLLDKIKSVYDLINAKNVVFHSCFSKNYKILEGRGFNYSIENEDFSSNYFNSVSEINNFLCKNKDYNFTFDFAHAYSVYGNELLCFVDNFNSRIVQVHIALLKGGVHSFLYNSGFNKLLKDFNRLINDKVIITSELCLKSFSDLKFLGSELNYLRSVFK